VSLFLSDRQISALLFFWVCCAIIPASERAISGESTTKERQLEFKSLSERERQSNWT